MTILAKLVAQYDDLMGYITYVFECLDDEVKKESPYIMCTKHPNWNHKEIKLNEIGYLNFKEIIAGVDKWYDGSCMIPYNYDGVQFIRFITKPEIDENKEELIM